MFLVWFHPRDPAGTIDGQGEEVNGSTSRALPVVLALVAGIAFGSGGTISQVVAAQGFQVTNITCAQLVCAAVLLGVVCVAKRYALPVGKVALKLAAVGIFYAGTTFCYYLAIDRLSVGCAVAFQFQYVWIALVIGSIAARCLPRPKAIVCAALVVPGSLLGSGLVDEAIAGKATFDFFGITLAIACAVCYALYMHFNAQVELEYPPLQRTFFQMCGAAIVAIAAVPFMSTQPMTIDIVPYGLIMGLIMGVLPCAFLAVASTRLSGSLIAVLSASELPAAIVTGVLVLGESCTALQVIGAAVICVAIAVSNLGASSD